MAWGLGDGGWRLNEADEDEVFKRCSRDVTVRHIIYLLHITAAELPAQFCARLNGGYTEFSECALMERICVRT